jgi:hypothetical protein
VSDIASLVLLDPLVAEAMLALPAILALPVLLVVEVKEVMTETMVLLELEVKEVTTEMMVPLELEVKKDLLEFVVLPALLDLSVLEVLLVKPDQLVQLVQMVK